MFRRTVIEKIVRHSAIIAIIATIAAGAAAAALVYQCGVGPCLGGGSESLSLQKHTIGYVANQANPTVLTMWIINSGTATATLSSLSIHDSDSANPVSLPVSASIAPKATGIVTVDTTNSGFYFTHGHTYNVAVSTPRFQFTFLISYS